MKIALNFKFKFLSIFWLVTAISLALSWEIKAQDITPPLPPQIKPTEPETLPLLEELLPNLQQSPSEESDQKEPEVLDTVFIQKFVIMGSTVFTPEELAAVLKPFTGRRVSFAKLLAAQQAIDKLYIENGYITSGTFLPPQQIKRGIVTIEVIEGSLEEIQLTGLDRLDADYVRSRLEIATKAPLQQEKLLNALQLLQLDPLIENLAAELTAGTKTGTSILKLELTETDPFDLTFSFDNFRAPSVGTNRLQARLTHRNLLGFGDRFNIGYLNTEGSDSLNDLNYTFPVNARNGTLNFRLSFTDSEIIEEPFDQIGIESENLTYEFTFRQPILQKPNEDIAIGFTFARNESTLDETFALSRGADTEGETNISALRFFQEYTNRNAKQVFALRSQFSLGLNLFDATINEDDLPDSEFVAWRGQLQYLRLLNPDLTLLLRSDLQFATEVLVPVEQFSLGGALSVRGFRQDALLGDNGWFNSAEIRATVVRIPKWKTSFQLTPFVDVGTVWNTDNLSISPNTLVSTGIGLRIQVDDYLAARLDWGIPLVKLETNGDTLQENGVYFSVEIKPF